VKAAKLDAATTFYALRHTHISLALLAKVNIQVLAENTGTSVRMIEQHYGKFLKEDRRKMFNMVTGLVPKWSLNRPTRLRQESGRREVISNASASSINAVSLGKAAP
jgi:hypothetical protein